MATVLITCAGSGVGQSVIDSLNLNRNHKLIGCDCNPDVYARSFCDVFHEVPSLTDDGYIDFLKKLCVKESIDIMAPGHDKELAMFAEVVGEFEAIGADVVVSEPEIVRISRDKKEWFAHFSEHGCRIVPTFSVGTFREDPDEGLFPAIVKPAGGSASQGILILNDPSELAEANDDDIIQPYLFPRRSDSNHEAILAAVEKGTFVQRSEFSIQLVFSKDSTCRGIFISKNALKNGVPVLVDPIPAEEFEYLDEIKKFIPVLESQGARGPVNIQGRITETGLYFFEMNMRFTGITGTRAKLGFNEVEYLVNDFLGNEAQLEAYTPNNLGVRQVACATVPRFQPDTSRRTTYTLLGAGGFVGSAFFKSLFEKDEMSRINLICRDDSYDDYVARFTGSDSKNVRVVRASDSIVEAVYAQTDVLVNFAGALAYFPDEQIYQALLFQFEQTQKIVEAGIPIVINVSSQSVYDQRIDEEMSEDATVELSSAYAFQKYLGEEFFHSITARNPLAKTVSLRFGRILGGSDQQKANGFFGRVVDRLMDGESVDLPFPQNKTNVIDRRDVTSAVHFAIEKAQSGDVPHVLNAGGVNLSIQEYCERVLDVLGAPEKRNLIEMAPTDEVKVSSMIDSTAIRRLGWKPEFGVDDIVRGFIGTRSLATS